MNSIGKAGEDKAAIMLEERGISIIARNFRSKSGEIDLIGIDGDTLIFIEVKTWSALSIDNLEYSINKKKQKRIIETANYFLQINRKYMSMALRFDVVFMGQDIFTHLESAFTESL